MPEYIWQFVCSSHLEDGQYHFPEGIVTICFGYMKWEASAEN